MSKEQIVKEVLKKDYPFVCVVGIVKKYEKITKTLFKKKKKVYDSDIAQKLYPFIKKIILHERKLAVEKAFQVQDKRFKLFLEKRDKLTEKEVKQVEQNLSEYFLKELDRTIKKIKKENYKESDYCTNLTDSIIDAHIEKYKKRVSK